MHLVIGFEGFEGRIVGCTGLGDVAAVAEEAARLPGVETLALRHMERKKAWAAIEAWRSRGGGAGGGAPGRLVLYGFSWGADAARRISVEAARRLGLVPDLVAYVDGIKKSSFLLPGFGDFSPRRGPFRRFLHWNSPLDVLRLFPLFGASRSLDDPPEARRALNLYQRADWLLHGQPIGGMENRDLTETLRALRERVRRHSHWEISYRARPLLFSAIREALESPPAPPSQSGGGS